MNTGTGVIDISAGSTATASANAGIKFGREDDPSETSKLSLRPESDAKEATNDARLVGVSVSLLAIVFTLFA